ncbi:MAG TPA: hypothetical protein GX726_03190, partial [Clostridiales bacterium]|nr:hypothetical protein [Clostridiales bacterium]
ITVVTLSDMASGPQHLHILAKSGAGNVSDVLTVSMPYDLYFFEDFEIYDGITNTNPVHHIPTHDGAGTDEQKVISVAQADGTTGKVFRLQGTRNMISERRVDLPSEITAMVVYEADIKPISEEPGGIQLRGSSPGWDDAVIREALRGGKFYSWTGEGGLSGFKYSEVDYSTDTWYKLRVEWDYLKKSFNYYVNNNWVGSDILSANATDILNSFELTSGNSGGGDEVYFDNIKFYAYPAPKLTSVTAPAAMTLANEYASTDAVISGGELPATVAVTAEDGTVTLPCVWSFPAGEYDAALGAGNTFRWTVNTFGYDVNNQTVSGSVIITNKAAPPVVDKPVISPDGGAFTGSQAVTLTCGTNGASVYYTTDGSEPSAASTLYAGAFTVFDTTTVKAIATKAGMTDSDVASATFTKNKLLSVTAPAAMTLANEYASADAVISGGELPATVAITAEDGAVTLLCVWSFPAGVYDAAPGAENSFRWTATTAGYDENGQTVSGDVIITNKAAPQPPAPPVRGGSGGSTYVAPVSSGSDRMDAKAKISGNTAAVTMDESKLEQLLGDENAGDTLTLAVTPGRNIHTASVNANELKKIAEAASDPNCPVKNMEIKLDTGTIQLDADALNSISSGDSKEPIEFHVENIPQEDLTAEQRGALPKENEQDIIVRVTVSQGGKKIGTFGGGKVTILIPYVLKEGQNPEGVRVWYVAPDGSLVAVEATYDAGLGVARIVTDHLSEFIVRYDETLVWENLFTDVLSGDWFYGAIKFVSLNKLMYGVGDNLFDPHGSMTRGMIVTILHRLEGTPEAKTANPFDDVAANKYYSKAIIWAAENDIVSGYGNSKFGPDDHITREQIAAIFMNYARYKGYDISARAELGKFADAGKVSGWAIDAMSWANAEALVKGDGVNLNPTANAERCQAAAIFQRFIENIK